jgi:transcriptional antiterminator Rof (Rho-off)
MAEAKQQLLEDAGFINELRHTIAASIVDDLAIVRKIRESLMLSLEELTDDKATPASLKSRALAALSTTLSITQAVNRKALNLDQIDPFTNPDTIPTLTIRKMTDADCLAVQKSMGKGDDDDDELAA